MFTKPRHFRPVQSPDKIEASLVREQAASLPAGTLREQVLRRARQAETGSNLTGWLCSPGLRAPE